MASGSANLGRSEGGTGAELTASYKALHHALCPTLVWMHDFSCAWNPKYDHGISKGGIVSPADPPLVGEWPLLSTQIHGANTNISNNRVY